MTHTYRRTFSRVLTLGLLAFSALALPQPTAARTCPDGPIACARECRRIHDACRAGCGGDSVCLAACNRRLTICGQMCRTKCLQ